MDKIDVTKCSLEVQQQLRNQFIRLRKKGWKLKAISEAIGVCRSTVANWSREYTKGGSKAMSIVKDVSEGLKKTITNEVKMEDEVGKFFVVTAPTSRSMRTDIVFETDIMGMFRQIKGGLNEKDIIGFYKNEAKANKVAKGLIK